MEHDREDSMDDMIGGIPPSINVGQMNARFHLSKMSTSYNSALLESDQNLLEGMMISNGGINTSAGISSHHHHLGASSSKAELPFVPTITASSNTTNSASKRTLSSLYWNHNDQDVAGTSSSNKRFNLESGEHNGSVVRTDQENNGTASSIATLLNQLPQTPSLHQQTMLGSIGDGLLRTSYQIAGMNWYA